MGIDALVPLVHMDDVGACVTGIAPVNTSTTWTMSIAEEGANTC